MKRRLLFTLLLATLWVALFAWVRHDSLRTRLSAHGLLHLAIAEQCARRVGETPALVPTPPENPLFAGTPLPYYYFFHEVALDAAALTGTSLLDAFDAIALLSVAGVVLVGAALGRLLLRSTLAGAALSFLVFAGAHPQGPLVLLARWWKHRDALFTRQGFAADGDYLWGLVHPALGALRVGDPHATLGPLASYFLNLTARPVALAALLACVLMVALAALRPGRLALAGVASAAALCTLFSPITGLAGALSLAGALLLVAWHERRQPTRWLPLRRALELGMALLVGVLASVPWWGHLLGRGDAGGELRVQPTRLLGMAASAWLLLGAAWFGAKRAGGAPRTLMHVLLVAAVPLLLATGLLALPVGNEDNFFHAACVLLAVPAAGIVLPRPRGVMDARELPRQTRRRALLLVACCAPTLCIVGGSYLGRAPLPYLRIDGVLERRPDGTAAGGDEAQLLAWVRDVTPRDAIVVRDPGPRGRMATGNTSELPALTRHALFTDYASHYLVEAHPDAPRRARLTERLLSGAPLEADDQRYLAALERPFCLVADGVDEAREAALAARYGAPAFASGELRAYLWRPAP